MGIYMYYFFRITRVIFITIVINKTPSKTVLRFLDKEKS